MGRLHIDLQNILLNNILCDNAALLFLNVTRLSYEPRHEKNEFVHMRLCFRYSDSTLRIIFMHVAIMDWST